MAVRLRAVGLTAGCRLGGTTTSDLGEGAVAQLPAVPGPAPRASIVDVARRAGVSVATVSRALRDMPNVSQATRDRVLKAAADLQYAASPLASGLVTGRVRSVGVILPYAGRWFFAEVVRGIEEALREDGYDLVLHVLADARRRRDFFSSLPVRRRVDAVILVALPLDHREIELLRSLGLPMACVAEPMSGVHGERIDNAAAARLAVRHLVNLGHTRIACIGGDLDGPERFSVPGLRTEGYRHAMSEAGLTVRADWERDGSFTARGGELAMTALLSQPGGRPTAVFCQSDEMAFGALRALRRSGLRCPDDVSIVGVDDHELAETFDMTTVAQPVVAQGAAAARWVVKALQLGTDAHLPVDEVNIHPARLVLRGSTGPAPTEAVPAG
ncbi:MAG TPA: LacI family DNA-binding transcriptional regulator [Kineosporiaceae bacterium]|nr:LacI family DNA-binding transcriptional regulator [Kineosporiaceae bacterium]